MVVFIDDILVYSAEDHKEHLLPTLQTLVGKELYAKFKKLQILAKESHILGSYNIEMGISVHPKKVEAIVD